MYPARLEGLLVDLVLSNSAVTIGWQTRSDDIDFVIIHAGP